MTHNDVPAFDKLQAHLEHGDVQEVDEVAQVIHEEPEVDVVCPLVREGPAHRDQPAVPVPGQHHKEQPQDVHEVWGRGDRNGLEGQQESAPPQQLCMDFITQKIDRQMDRQVDGQWDRQRDGQVDRQIDRCNHFARTQLYCVS